MFGQRKANMLDKRSANEPKDNWPTKSLAIAETSASLAEQSLFFRTVAVDQKYAFKSQN